MIAVERTRATAEHPDGEIRLIVRGEPVKLPEPGQALVFTPETRYAARIDRSSDVIARESH